MACQITLERIRVTHVSNIKHTLHDAQTHLRQSFVLDCIRHMPRSARVQAVLATLLERFTFLLFIGLSSSVSIMFARQADGAHCDLKFLDYQKATR